MTAEEFKITTLGKAALASPLKECAFVQEGRTVVYDTDASVVKGYIDRNEEIPAFELAGPREKIFHDPAWSRAAILTAGGLCPGLNEVVKFLTLTLIQRYGVPVVYGIRYGYRGLNPRYGLSPLMLDENVVDNIHEEGGTILGSSRGEEDVDTCVDTLVRMNVNMLFCIGGDGTARGAHAVAEAAARRKLPLSVIAIPKTIDNDIGFIDTSFGFATAVLNAGRAVTGVHNEAKGAFNGVGLVKVMGRDSGFIAASATMANPFVNYCLVPEVDFDLESGDHALLPHLLERLNKRHHAVIIVAEGAGQKFFDDKTELRDASGNILKKDIGLLLKDRITGYCKAHGAEVSVKYFDLGYTIRSVPAEGTDAIFCGILAQNAVHAAMSGRTDMMVGHWAGKFTHVPIALTVRARKKIQLDSPLWTSVKSITVF
ncbi:MAG: ATP-dependent 6-phosphofructokinase [Lentisphaeria bacterium]|nr:ATP-dependent 6-phosphofructokinase [Lentisphaeria bacterium]